MCLGEAGVFQVLQKRRWRELKAQQISPGLLCAAALCKRCNSITCAFTQAKERLEKLICVVGKTTCVVLWVTSGSGSQRWLTAEN